MRQPWNQKPVVFRIVIDDRRDDRRDVRSSQRPPDQARARAAPPEARIRPPWRMIAAVAGASLLGIWLLRPTKPPRPWIEASKARAKRLEELEERHLREREREREHEREARRLTPPPLHRRPTTIDGSRSLPSSDERTEEQVGRSGALSDSYDDEAFGDLEDLDEP